MGFNEEIIELSECLTEEQIVEYMIRLSRAQEQFHKTVQDLLQGGNEITHTPRMLNALGQADILNMTHGEANAKYRE